jgi:hypothetical protein
MKKKEKRKKKEQKDLRPLKKRDDLEAKEKLFKLGPKNDKQRQIKLEDYARKTQNTARIEFILYMRLISS